MLFFFDPLVLGGLPTLLERVRVDNLIHGVVERITLVLASIAECFSKKRWDREAAAGEFTYPGRHVATSTAIR